MTFTRFTPSLHQVSHVALSGATLAYTGTTSADREASPDEVVVRDLAKGTSSVVARSRWKDGLTDWVELVDGWVFWTDMSSVPDDSYPLTAWAIYGRRVSGGAATRLAGSDRPSMCPLPRAGHHRLVWSTDDGGAAGTMSIQVFDTARGATTALARGVHGARTLAPAQDGVVYDATGTGETSDLWEVAYGGGSPVRLTRTGTARNPAASHDSDDLTWDVGEPNSDPTALALATPTSAGAPETVPSAGVFMETAGDGFVAYDDSASALKVHTRGTSASSDRTLTTEVVSACRIAADRHRVAYCEQTDAGPLTVVVATVS